MKTRFGLKLILTAVMITLLTAFLTISASAASVEVADGDQFAAAMEQAKNGEIDTIILKNDITSTVERFYPAASRNITIKSVEGQKYTISSTKQLEIGITSGIFNNNKTLRATLNIQNVTFDMGYTQRAFYVSTNGGVLNLENVTIQNGQRSNNNGGAVWIGFEANFNNVSITNCSVVSSASDKTSLGGAIYVNGGKLTMNGGSISNCQTNGGTYNNGGAIYAQDSEITINGTTISFNTAAWQGGGIFAKNCTITMNSGNITGNTVTGNMGGGVALRNTHFTMNGGEISGNTCYSSGGNVMISEKSVFDYYYTKGARITNGIITSDKGWSNSTDFIIQNAVMDDNTLNVYMKNLVDGDLTLDNSHAPRIHNRISDSDSYSGNYNLIYTLTSDARISSTWNLAATKPATQTQGTSAVAPVFRYIIRGGGFTIAPASEASFTVNGYLGSGTDMVSIPSNSVVVLENITLDAENTTNLRPLYLKSGNNVTIGKDAVITGGNSGTLAGGIFVNKSTLTLDGGIIKNNVGTHGGGVALASGSTMIINSGEMTGNIATNRGGAIHLQDANASVLANHLIIYDADIHANYTTSSSGGAINIGNSIASSQNIVDMYGGKIYDHLSCGQGVVAVRANCVFNMYGGEIYGNARGNSSMTEISNRGGGIWLAYGGTFNMLKDTTGKSTSVPTIRNNRSTYGSAIDIENGTVNLTHGLITGNVNNLVATNTTTFGAIWAQQGSLTIGEDMNIYGNTSITRNQEENIFISSANISLKIGSNLTGKVGIYSANHAAGTVLAAANSGVTSLGGIFLDNSNKPVVLNGSNVVILDGITYNVTLLPSGNKLSVAGSATYTVNYADFSAHQGSFTQYQFLGLADVSNFGTNDAVTNALYTVGDTVASSSIVGELYAIWVDINTFGAASAKVAQNSGLKFITTVNSSIFDSLGLSVKGSNDSGDGYVRGTLLGIVGKNDLVFGGNYGANVAIQGSGWLSSDKYLSYVGKNNPLAEGYNAFSASLVYGNSNNYNKAVSFRGYVTVTLGDVSSTVYSAFNPPTTLVDGDNATYTSGQHARSARAVIRTLYFTGTEAEAKKALGSDYPIGLAIAGYTWDGYNTDWVNTSDITATNYSYQPTFYLLKNTSVYGKNLNSALQNVSKSGDSISGSIEYVANYSGYTSALSSSEKDVSIAQYENGKYGYGYFLPFELYAPVSDYSNAVIEIISGSDKRTLSGASMSNYRINVALRIDPNSDSVVVKCDWDGAGSKYEPCVTVLDLSGLTFNNRSGVDAIRELALSYDRRGAWIQYETYDISYNAFLSGSGVLRINSSALPEDATSNNILYLDCASFIHAVYTQALGHALDDKESVDIVDDYPSITEFYYKPTRSETDAEKAAILADFEAILQPGDLIAYAYSDANGNSTLDGHTMIYLGDGMMIHCEGTGNFRDGMYQPSSTGKPYDIEEVNGAITYESIYDTLLKEGHARYLFNSKHRFAIVRVLDDGDTVTTEAEKRLDVLQGVVIEKISSHPVGRTADRDENITITYNITNNATEERSFTLKSTLPSGTTLVSGNLSQDITLAAGETKTVSFTAKVNSSTSYDTVLNFTSRAGDMKINTCSVTVGKNLTTAQVSSLTSLITSGSFTSTNSFDLMKEVYSKIGATLNLGDATDIHGLWDDIFKRSNTSYVTMKSSTNTAGYKMLAPNLYGGARLNDGTGLTARVKKLTTDALQAGDIIIFAKNPSASLPSSFSSYCDMYIYLGNDTFLTYDGGVKTFTADGKTLTSHPNDSSVIYLDDELTQLFGSAAFAVLRPSLY